MGSESLPRFPRKCRLLFGLVLVTGIVNLNSVQFARGQPLQAGQGAAPAASNTAWAQKPIFLDVTATDSSGKAVADLEPFDLSLKDEDQPRKILGFRRTDGVVGSKLDPPVEVIIVLDAVNLPYQAVTRLRLDLDRFLRANDGHLTQPVSIYMLTSQGLRVQPSPSKDGNALAAMLDGSVGTVRARDLSGGVYSLQEQFEDSIKAVTGMTENLAHRPGRKVVIWLGPGWPLLTERFFIQTNESRPAYFRQLASLKNSLREARVTIYSLYTLAGITPTLWQRYAKPVREAGKMEIGYMGLQVLAEYTGGRVLPPSNDVKSQIDQCVAEIGEYYTIAMMPPATNGHDEYHDLKVAVNRPGVVARTFSGYHNEPAAQ